LHYTHLQNILLQLQTLINIKTLAPQDLLTDQLLLKKNSDILNIFVSKTPSNLFHYINNILALNSDHSSVVLTLNEYLLTCLVPPKLFNATTDCYKFHDLVNQKIKLNVRLKSTDDIDLAVNSFTNIIQSAAWSTISEANHLFSYQPSCWSYTYTYSGKTENKRPVPMIPSPISLTKIQ